MIDGSWAHIVTLLGDWWASVVMLVGFEGFWHSVVMLVGFEGF